MWAGFLGSKYEPSIGIYDHLLELYGSSMACCKIPGGLSWWQRGACLIPWPQPVRMTGPTLIGHAVSTQAATLHYALDWEIVWTKMIKIHSTQIKIASRFVL